jgi:hypothetical protein
MAKFKTKDAFLMHDGRSVAAPYLGSQCMDYLYYQTAPWEEFSGLKLTELYRMHKYENSLQLNRNNEIRVRIRSMNAYFGMKARCYIMATTDL